eukprot:SAG31_NODE_26606_length_439_cov_1.097059_1_plen_65_part_10
MSYYDNTYLQIQLLWEMLSVLRRVMQRDPNFFLVVSETAPLGRFEAGADKAAIVLTQQLRRICAG